MKILKEKNLTRTLAYPSQNVMLIRSAHQITLQTVAVSLQASFIVLETNQQRKDLNLLSLYAQEVRFVNTCSLELRAIITKAAPLLVLHWRKRLNEQPVRKFLKGWHLPGSEFLCVRHFINKHNHFSKELVIALDQTK